VKVLVTGLGGTVGRAFGAVVRAAGHTVVGWDRAAVPIDRYDAMDAFVGATAPDAVVNLAIASQPTGRERESWLVNYEWPSELAWICRQRGLRFLHTSTVMVFSGATAGPFTLASPADAPDGYGHEKRLAEHRVLSQYPHAVVARLGWQIGDAPGSNNMIDYFARVAADQGEIRASSRFLPACSFLADTADALVRLLDAPPGLYQLDANTHWTMLDIARALAAPRGWRVVETDIPAQDQRMLDPRPAVASLRTRLPQLQ
jgi:dTDP-4-dehydrorhamnose reductase